MKERARGKGRELLTGSQSMKTWEYWSRPIPSAHHRRKEVLER